MAGGSENEGLVPIDKWLKVSGEPQPTGFRYAPSLGILTAFHGRMSQVIVIMQTLVKMSGGQNTGGVKLEVAEVIDRLESTFETLNRHLSNIEDEHNIGRGERLSVAFPISNGSKRIMFKTWLGIDLQKREVVSDGTLMDSMLETPNANQIVVTEYERRVSDLPDLEVHLLSLSRPLGVLGDRRPYLPIFYDEEISTQIIAKMHMVWPHEYDHLIHVLGLVNQASQQDRISGWNSNEYAINETKMIAAGNGQNRWGGRFWRYLENAKRKGKRNPEIVAADKMIVNINSTLGGIIGRMKELGIARPVRSGNVKNLLITEFGSRIMDLHNEDAIGKIWRGDEE